MGEEANVVDFVDEALARFYGAAIPGLEAAFTIPYTCPTRKHSRPSIVDRGTGDCSRPEPKWRRPR